MLGFIFQARSDVLPVNERRDDDSAQDADGDGNEHQARLARGPSFVFGEDYGISGASNQSCVAAEDHRQ